MKTIRRIYSNFDRMISNDPFDGWCATVLCHFWVLWGVTYLVIREDGTTALLMIVLAIFTYSGNVYRLDLKEARAELARLRADQTS